MLQCIRLSNVDVLGCESLLLHGITHLSLSGCSSLAELSQSPAASSLTRLAYREALKNPSQTDVSFHFPELRNFVYEDVLDVNKFKALVPHPAHSRELHTLRFNIALAVIDTNADPDPVIQIDIGTCPTNVWRKLFRDSS